MSRSSAASTMQAVLGELKVRAGEVPLVVAAPFADFCRALESHRLPGGVLYGVHGAPSSAEANRWMEKVRAYQTL